MAQSLPWSVKGIDADTRDAAREAARRAGMSVSDWLEHVIREETRKGQVESSQPTYVASGHAAGPDVNARLRRLAQSGSGAALERGLDRSADRNAGRARQLPQQRDELDLLLEHAAKLESRTRDQEAKTTNALESIVGWIEKAESRMAASERAAAERQERATSVIADAIKTVSSRVADVERRANPHADPAYPRAIPEHAGSPPQTPQSRRPVLSRDGLAHAISDIQVRKRELSEPSVRPRPATIMQNLRDDLGRMADQQQAERRIGDRRADVTPLMNGLRADLAQLRSEISSLSAQPASSRLEDSIRDLAQRLDTRTPPALDELARPLARIEAELSRLQAQNPTDRFGRIESEIQRLGERIETLASMSHEPRLLAAAVQELTGLKDALTRNNQAPRLDDLSSQIATLAHDMGRVREEITRSSPSNEVETAIEDMREALMRETRDANGIGHGLLTRITQQLETVSAAVGQVPSGGMADSDRQQLALLSHKLDQLAQRTQPESDALARRIEDLAIKLDDMSDRSSHELIERVERLSDQIDALAARGPAAIEKQIDALAARIETLAKTQQSLIVPSSTTAVDLTPIEDMIGDLARKLEDVSRPEPNPKGLQALEKQIAALADRLDKKPATSTKSDALDATLHDLMRSLGGLREETASAVDRAARAAVADVLTRMPTVAEAPDFSSIRDDLAGLKDVHVSIDRRTNSAIGAVNDTLEKIVQRLAQLEDDISRERISDVPLPKAQRLGVEPPAHEALSSHLMQERAPSAPVPVRMQNEPVSEQVTTAETVPARESARELVASAQRTIRQPVVTAQADTDPLPDLPLEPGSGRPRGRSDAPAAPAIAGGVPNGGSVNPNLIAAARRAAMAASAEVDANKADDRKAGKTGKLPRLALPTSLRETLEKRRKPILLGLAAIVLAIGAGQVATSMLSDPPKTEQVKPAKQTESPEARKTSSAEPGDGQASRAETAQPAQSAPQVLPKDQTSMTAPAPGSANLGNSADTTGSVRSAPVEIAALAPASTAPDPTRFSAVPGLVTNLGELPPTIGTAGLRRAALEGNANAVYELGVRATDGVGMARDHKLALRLFERAAAAGSAPAQFRLGNMHEKGIGTTRDAKLALTWYRRAAEKGNAKAMHNLAVLIAEGADGKPDYSEAAKLFRKAAEFGVRDSQFNLAILLGRGLGVEQDLIQSFTWFAVAARQGDTDAGKKRDEVGSKLSAVDLAAARNASLAWKAVLPDPVSNEVAAPAEGWDPAPRAPQPRTPPKQRAT